MKYILAISIAAIAALMPIAIADEGIPSFMQFFLSDFFITTIIAITIAGYIGHLAKSGIAFTIALIVFFLILTIAGVYPLWMLIVFSLLAGIIAYIIIRREGGKE